MNNKKIGIVLSGGGGRGSFQLGAFKALEEFGILKTINVSSGTSIGAINTLLLMITKNVSEIEDFWKLINNANVYKDGPAFLNNPQKGIYNLDSLKELISKNIKLDDIKQAKITGYVTTSKLPIDDSAITVQFSKKKLTETVFKLNDVNDPLSVVLASSSIPVIFGPTKIDEELYVDGGMLRTTPINPVLAEKCDIILVFPLDNKFKFDEVKENSLIIDFSYFGANFFSSTYEMFSFNPFVLRRNELTGYFVVKTMIKKLISFGILEVQDEKVIWNKVENCSYIELDDSDEKKIRENIKKELKKKSKFKVFIIGDSTAASKKNDKRPEAGWGEEIKDYFDDFVTFINMAENGLSTKSFIDSKKLELVEKRIKKGDYLLIQFGHNDGKIEDKTRFTDPNTTYKENLLKMVNVAKEKEAIPILITSVSRRKFIDSDKVDEFAVEEYPYKMIEFAKMNDIFYIDMFKITKELYESLGNVESKKLFLHLKEGINQNYPSGITDNTHFRTEGAKIIASIISLELASLEIDLNKHIVIKKTLSEEEIRKILDKI